MLTPVSSFEANWAPIQIYPNGSEWDKNSEMPTTFRLMASNMRSAWTFHLQVRGVKSKSGILSHQSERWSNRWLEMPLLVFSPPNLQMKRSSRPHERQVAIVTIHLSPNHSKSVLSKVEIRVVLWNGKATVCPQLPSLWLELAPFKNEHPKFDGQFVSLPESRLIFAVLFCERPWRIKSGKNMSLTQVNSKHVCLGIMSFYALRLRDQWIFAEFNKETWQNRVWPKLGMMLVAQLPWKQCVSGILPFFWGSKEHGISQFLLLNSVSRLQFHQSHTPELFTECLSQTELATGSQVGHGSMAPGSGQPPHYGKSPALFETRPAQAHASQGGPSLYTKLVNGWKRFIISVTVEELNKFGTLHQLWWNQQLQVAQSFRLSARNSRTEGRFRKACPSLLDSAVPAGRLETFEFQVLCHSNLRETNFPPRPRSDTNKSTSKRKIRKTDESGVLMVAASCSQLQPVAALQFQP